MQALDDAAPRERTLIDPGISRSQCLPARSQLQRLFFAVTERARRHGGSGCRDELGRTATRRKMESPRLGILLSGFPIVYSATAAARAYRAHPITLSSLPARACASPKHKLLISALKFLCIPTGGYISASVRPSRHYVIYRQPRGGNAP